MTDPSRNLRRGKKTNKTKTPDTAVAVATTKSPQTVLARVRAADDYRLTDNRAGHVEAPFDDDDAFTDGEQTEIGTADDDDSELTADGETVDRPARRRPSAHLRVWADPDNDLRVIVQPPSLSALADDSLASPVTQRWNLLLRYGQALVDGGGLSLEAIAATGYEQLYDAVGPWSEKSFAVAAKLKGGSQVSRDWKWITVGLPLGVLSLDFFFLKSSNSGSAEGLSAHEIVRSLMRDPEVMWGTVPAVQRAIPGAGSSVAKVLNWCRAAEVWNDDVVSAAARYLNDPVDAVGLVDRLALTLVERRSQLPATEQKRIGSIRVEPSEKIKKQNRHRPALARALVVAMDGLA